MREVVIVDGVRSAFGDFGGVLRSLPASEIAVLVVKDLLKRTQILERGKVDSLMCGSALVDEQTLAQARFIASSAGLPPSTAATYVEMQCGSAITCLNHAAWKILAGMSDIAIVGGMESHSHWPAKMMLNNPQYKDFDPRCIYTGLTPILERDTPMVRNSDLMAEKWNISREECDDFGYRSQQRLKEAYAKGITGPEIVPITVFDSKTGEAKVVDKDEHPRPNITREKIATLKPVYEGGVTTPGNASGRNDGAAFLLIMTAEKAKELGYEPRAKWVGGAHVGCLEHLMGIGASYSNLKAIKQLGLKLKDIDVFECNEAFAAQNLSVIKDMQETMGEKIDMEKWNPNGGAIAIGHPNGASGARVTMFGMKHLEMTGGKYGCISSCCGGGQGSTAIIENLRY